MIDFITLAIAGMFGVVTVLFVMFFFLIRQQSGKLRFGTQDYRKSYDRNGRYASGGNPFKQGPSQNRGEQQTIRAVIIPLAVIAILVSIFFDIFAGLLIIFLLPVVVRFIRMRNEPNSNKARNENHFSR
ncbi:MAG: hypothetical protein ACYCPP_09495 [Nitrososphaerales archaeon]